MVKPINRLTALAIKNAKDGSLIDGNGLTLAKSSDGGKWTWRYTFAGSRREMGLGAYPTVSLAQARKSRDKWAAVLADGTDPISERNRLLAEAKAVLDRVDPTLAEVTALAFTALKAGLKGDGDRGRWLSPLNQHILPKLGKKRLSTIRQTDIADALRQIGTTKPPTAEKAIQRIGIVFNWSKLAGIECDPWTILAARHVLGKVRHVTKGIPATPWQEVPALYRRLTASNSGHRSLRMAILTCARADSVRGTRFDEIDRDVWTVPGGRRGRCRSPYRPRLA